MKKTCTVAFPTYNRWDYLIESVEQLLQVSPSVFQVVIIDQSDSMPIWVGKWIMRVGERVSLTLDYQATPSLPLARNRAIELSKGDVVLFLDDDINLRVDIVSLHMLEYEKNSDVVCVGGRVIQPTQVYGKTDAKRLVGDPLLDYKYLKLDGDVYYEGVASIPGGNHSVIRTEAIKIGGYDIRFIGSALREESDFAVRMWRSGLKIVYNPAAAIIHIAAPAGGCRPRDIGRFGWKIPYPSLLFLFKNIFPRRMFWKDYLFFELRRSVLTKKNIMSGLFLSRLIGYVIATVFVLIDLVKKRKNPYAFVR